MDCVTELNAVNTALIVSLTFEKNKLPFIVVSSEEQL